MDDIQVTQQGVYQSVQVRGRWWAFWLLWKAAKLLVSGRVTLWEHRGPMRPNNAIGGGGK